MTHSFCSLATSNLVNTPMPIEAKKLRKGQVFGKYTVTNNFVLGSGGFGEVYSVSAQNHLMYAMKLIYPEKFKQDFRCRFYNLEMLADLDHTNIVRFVERGFVDNYPYIITELVNGVPLSTLKEDLRIFQESYLQKLIKKIVREVCAATSELNSIGIVNPDLSPPNIMFDSSNTSKLIDLDTHLFSPFGNLEFTNKPFMGKMAYAAPETLSHSSYSPRSEVYSIGLILYELIEGDQLFPHLANIQNPSSSDVAIMLRKQIDPDFFPDSPWKDIFANSLAFNPSKRFRDAAEMQSALLQIIL